MPLQNRVTPFGTIVAHPARGTFMGNRGGRIHDPQTKTLLARRWASRRWIVCVLDFKNRRRRVMGKGYTELFFFDEATALAAGHRPCYECRRADALAFAEAWRRGNRLSGAPSADDIDRRLHDERLAIFAGVRREAYPKRLPDGVIISDGEAAYLKRGNALNLWTPDGYRSAKPKAPLYLLTPPSTVAAIGAGYAPR